MSKSPSKIIKIKYRGNISSVSLVIHLSVGVPYKTKFSSTKPSFLLIYIYEKRRFSESSFCPKILILYLDLQRIYYMFINELNVTLFIELVEDKKDTWSFKKENLQ